MHLGSKGMLAIILALECSGRLRRKVCWRHPKLLVGEFSFVFFVMVLELVLFGGLVS